MIYILKLLSPIGLIMDIIGAFLIFKYGLPEEISRSGSGFLVFEKDNPEEKALAAKFDRLSKIGFRLLILGFTLQLIPSLFNLCDNEQKN
jgi:hypothetical protein